MCERDITDPAQILDRKKIKIQWVYGVTVQIKPATSRRNFDRKNK